MNQYKVYRIIFKYNFYYYGIMYLKKKKEFPLPNEVQCWMYETKSYLKKTEVVDQYLSLPEAIRILTIYLDGCAPRSKCLNWKLKLIPEFSYNSQFMSLLHYQKNKKKLKMYSRLS